MTQGHKGAAARRREKSRKPAFRKRRRGLRAALIPHFSLISLKIAIFVSAAKSCCARPPDAILNYA